MKITLKAARVNAGLKQKDLAKALNRNVGTILNWEKGYTRIPLDDFKEICKILDVREDQIFLPTKSS